MHACSFTFFRSRNSVGDILLFRGGGNVENPQMDRSRPPLRWMVYEAGKLGLRTAPFERELSPDEQINERESLTLLWWQGKLTTHK